MKYQYSYRVIYGDTDQAGMVYHANYLRFFEAARTELVRSAGYAYKNLETKHGIMLPVVEVFLRFKAPVYYDEVINIQVWLEEVKPFRLKFRYEVYKDEILAAVGYTLHVPVNKEGKIVRFPERVYKLLKELEGD